MPIDQIQGQSVFATGCCDKNSVQLDDGFVSSSSVIPPPSLQLGRGSVWFRATSTWIVVGFGLIATLIFTLVKHSLDQESLFVGLVISSFMFNLIQLIKIKSGGGAFISEKTHLAVLREHRSAIQTSEREHAEIAIHLLHSRNSYLEQDVSRYIQEAEARSDDIRSSQDVTMIALASLASTRDNETGNHISRTQHYIRSLANHLRHHPRFSSILNDNVIELLFKAAPLHDIGKVGIPDKILLKPDRLNVEEMAIMKTHTTLGRNAIKTAQERVGKCVPQLDIATEIAFSHHEKWDGSGYPEGLAGDAIPLSARLMAIADVYDALISVRVYKPAMSHDRAVANMFQLRSTHFDPDMVDAFIEIQDEFQAISHRYADTPADMEMFKKAA